MRKSRFILFIFMLHIGMAFASAATLEKEEGNFRVKVSDDGGAFNISYISEKTNSPVDFFVSHNDYASTLFSVLLDNTVYELRRGSVSSIGLVEKEQGVGLVFNVRDELKVGVNFSFVPELSSAGQGIMRVDVALENISDNAMEVALKGIFDTVLGENSGVHFATAPYPYVSTEESFIDMSQLQWVRSSNGNESIQFLFDGKGITSPKMVAVANKDVFLTDRWMPVIKSGRTFNSVFSYNNSAICAVWNPVTLAPTTKGAITFYITMASKAKMPLTATVLGQDTTGLTKGDDIIYTNDDGVVFTLGAITDNMLNMQYINDLLNRIKKLEEDPANIDRNELLHLNAELDAILEKVRRL